MKRRNTSQEQTGFAAWARRAVIVVSVLAGGLGVALAALAAPLPAGTATATPYSWPTFHAGGTNAPTGTEGGAGIVPYGQQQGTPSGFYPPTGALSQIPSLILGNTGAGAPTPPPGSGGANGYVGTAPNLRVDSFLNHFFNGPDFQNHYYQITGPLGFTQKSGTVAPYARLQGSPTVVNATEYPEINYMYYDGVAASPQNAVGNGTIEQAPDPTPSGTPPNNPTGVVTTGSHAIRQVVFYGRTETVPVVKDPTTGLFAVGGVPVPVDAKGNPQLAEGTPVNVGAIYAMDGFTGGVIWRYQTPAFSASSVGSPNSFTATINGNAASANTNGPQPFQVGPDAHDSGGVIDDSIGLPAGQQTGPGVFFPYTPSPKSSLPASPAAGYRFALYALTDTPGANNTVAYTGDWRLFPVGSNPDDANIVASGTFTVTATFDLVTDPTGHYATVAGTFSANAATSPTFAAGFPAQFNGTFDARTGTQVISGSLQTIPGGGTGGTFRNGSVLSSLSVARVNVEVPVGYPGFSGSASAAPTANYATKLVVIATDNNGYVYCLDALGNGYRDAATASNGNVLYQTSTTGPNPNADTLTAGQVHYDVLSSETYGAFPNPPDAQPHVGTTFPYWIYRPDPNQPKYVAPLTNSKTQTVGAVKATADFDATRDLPVPQAFNNASPTVYVAPGQQVDYDLTAQSANGTPQPNLGTLIPGKGPGAFTVTTIVNGSPVATTPALGSNALVFAGNSNGVLYALDALGVANATGQPDPNANLYNNSVTGNPGIDDTVTPANTPNTTNTKWWFQAPGASPASTDNPVSIESAPAVLSSTGGDPTVYIGTSNPLGGSDNSGRLYAVDVLTGPTGNAGSGSMAPGSIGYNVDPEGLWSFPNAYGKTTYPALGNITGSPVVFNNTDDGTTRIYFAANTGNETITEGTGTQSFPPSDDSGRVWAVNTDGSFGFAYPSAPNPNSATPGPATPPMGGFLHATPAIGFVTYPASIYYLASATDTGTAFSITDAAGTTTFNGSGTAAALTKPMLYIGTFTGSDVTGSALYYLDLDGTTDSQRSISVVQAPNGSSFQSSPILVANTTNAAAGGNGGSIFVTTSSNNLIQYQATPITTANADAPYPTPRQDYTFPAGDAVSSPAVGAANVSDVTGTNTNVITGVTTTTENVTDWVYVGDFTTGQCFGFTPRGFGTDTTGGYLPGLIPPVPPALNLSPVISQFPLRAYIFDGSTNHPANATDMNKANPYGQTSSTLPVFEWGQTVYFRIANVVPPGTPVSPTDLYTVGDNGTVQDPTTPGSYFGSGGPVTIQTTEIDSSGQNIPGTVDTFVLPSSPQALITDPSTANGFFERTGGGTTQTLFNTTSELTGAAGSAYRAPETELIDGKSSGYAYGITYNVGFNNSLDSQGATRHNTPGARRKLINVTQSVIRYTPSATAGVAPTQQPATLQLVTDPNFSYQTTDGSGNAATGNLYVDEPTFGILNPLAVRAAGYNLTPPANPTHNQLVAPPWTDTSGEGAGPFRGIDPTKALGPVDMEALANGNSVLTVAPPSGVLATTGNPTQGTGVLQSNAATYTPYYRYVIATTTGQVGHGTNGDNTDPHPQPLVPGTLGSGGAGVAAGANYGSYLFNIADRSMLGDSNGGVAVGVVNTSIQRARLGWNDNTGAGGPGARINPLIWEDYPFVGQNNSLDYPDIQANNLTEYIGGNTSQPLITPSKQPLPLATPDSANAAPPYRDVQLTSVQVNVHVPKYQPANLQLWATSGTGGGGPITPAQYQSSPAAYNFPEGYVAHQRIGATSNPNGTPNSRDPNNAYREVYIYTGVPVDMTTSISNATTDIGIVPHGFGVQMSNYTPVSGGGAIGPFTPYNQYLGYEGHFIPLTIYNDGNTNLINPHLDQKINAPNAPSTLPLLSDALDSSLFDPLSFIPAFDFNGVRTGPRTGLSGAEQPYLVRSSLDTDLQPFGRNLGLSGSLPNPYPGLTFHKPRVSDGTNPNFLGTLMTVPDLPHDAYNAYSLPLVQHQLAMNGSQPVDPLNGNLPSATQPYLSVAVPLGTPVGTYSQTVRMFEGRDPNYNPLVGPTYTLGTDLFSPVPSATSVPQPYTDPGTTVKVSVREDRLTDGFVPGALPQIDPIAQGPGGLGAADFAPAAFRDPLTGALSMYWTTARHYKMPSDLLTTSLYTIAGANLSFNGTSNNAYFAPASGNQQWWAPISASATAPFGTLLPAGNNVGWSVAPDQRYALNGALDAGDNSVYGFDTNVSGNGANASTNIDCYPLTAATGALGAGTSGGTVTRVPVANSPLPKSGVHGLKFTGISFTDPNGGAAIGNDLWAFWAGGAQGRTALYYSSAASGAVGSYSGSGASPFTGAAVLPVPASLTSVSNPTAVLTYGPDPTPSNSGKGIPVIEVTYAGVSPTGIASVYVSRYRPYHPSTNGKVLDGTNGTNDVILLTQMPFRQLTEQLQSDPRTNWWQARDVGWLRNNSLNVGATVTVNNTVAFTASLLRDLNKTNADGITHPLYPNVHETYDRASGLLVYTGVTLPAYVAGSVTSVVGQTIFVDVGSGRIRFSLPLPASVNGTTQATSVVTATFNPMARRITTDPVANTAPTAFLDEAYEPSASGSGANVLADRYWFFWQKPAVADAKVGPSLWYKTQRLTVVVTDPATGLPVTNIPTTATVTVNGSAVPVDVDPSRGRVYFPVTSGGVAMEGQVVTVSGTTVNGTVVNSTATIHWLDEPRYNDPFNQILGNDTTPGAMEASVADGYQVPINTIKNEGGVTSFLDPLAYNNTTSNIAAPHSVWLFWNSTRNGTSDIFYETINPRFAPVTPASGAP